MRLTGIPPLTTTYRQHVNLQNYTKLYNYLLEDAIFHYVIDSAKYNFLRGDRWYLGPETLTVLFVTKLESCGSLF